MKALSGNILFGTTLFGLLMIQSNHQAEAQESKIFPITNQMVAAISKAADAKAAQEALCKQGGVIRGTGSSAGDTCKLQDFARVAMLSCNGYVNGKDAFKDSKCEQNAKKVGITDVQKAADSLKAVVQANVPYLTNSKLLVCGPEGDAGYRNKLPAALKKIADEACVAKPVEGAAVRKRSGAVTEASPAILAVREKLKAAAKQNGVYLGEIVKSLNSAGKVTAIGGQALGVKAITIPEVKNPATKANLLKVAQELSLNMKKLNAALDEDTTLAPQQQDVKEILNFQNDLEKVKTEDELLNELEQMKKEFAHLFAQ